MEIYEKPRYFEKAFAQSNEKVRSQRTSSDGSNSEVDLHNHFKIDTRFKF